MDEPSEAELYDARQALGYEWPETREVEFSQFMLQRRFPEKAAAVVEFYNGRRTYWRLVEPDTRRSWQERRAYEEAIEWGATFGAEG